MRQQSPVLVIDDEDQMRNRFTHQYKYEPHGLVSAIEAKNVPSKQVKKQVVDLVWSSGDQMIAGDIKTPQDFIASYTDGRLHKQITDMQKMHCRFFYIFLEGPLSHDGGDMVGGHASYLRARDWRQM